MAPDLKFEENLEAHENLTPLEQLQEQMDALTDQLNTLNTGLFRRLKDEENSRKSSDSQLELQLKKLGEKVGKIQGQLQSNALTQLMYEKHFSSPEKPSTLTKEEPGKPRTASQRRRRRLSEEGSDGEQTPKRHGTNPIDYDNKSLENYT